MNPQKTASATVKRQVQRGVRRAIGWYVEPAAAAAAERVATELRGRLDARDRRVSVESIAVDVEMLKAQLRSLQARVAELEERIRSRDSTQ